MEISRKELKIGLSESKKYILSHHEQSNWDRCHNVPIFSRNVHICARCSGIYPGIIAGIITFSLYSEIFPALIMAFILPLPALIDWSLTSFTKRSGNNAIRSMSGALLGYGYGFSLVELFVINNFRILWLGFLYILIVGSLLWILHHRVNLYEK